ncbi:hypothetical protein M2150_001661 [Lachnospiraceae bacterium PM6-15]|uniref:hypothetical protein n=1 Tax=Ohessyouella blattaphilus TaxID=2949333 RepID=UPI003E240554
MSDETRLNLRFNLDVESDRLMYEEIKARTKKGVVGTRDFTSAKQYLKECMKAYNEQEKNK